MLVGYSVKQVMICTLYVYMYMANKKRDREAAASGTMSDDEKLGIEQGMRDLTEIQNKSFRYSL